MAGAAAGAKTEAAKNQQQKQPHAVAKIAAVAEIAAAGEIAAAAAAAEAEMPH